MAETHDRDRQVAVVVGAAGGIGRALICRLEADPRFDHVVALSRARPDGWPEDAACSWRAADILDEVKQAMAAKMPPPVAVTPLVKTTAPAPTTPQKPPARP